MSQLKQEKKFKYTIAEKLSENAELHQYEEGFRRWLGREIHSGRISGDQAIGELGITKNVVKQIVSKYKPDLDVTLPVMTEAEKKKLEKQEQRIKELEKKLEDAQIKNIALETLVDVAEKEFKIPIRKKPGAKQ